MMSEQVVNEGDAQVINVKDIKEEEVVNEEEDVQADYIIPIKRKLGVNDDNNVIKRQRSILNAYNSPEKEEISEI